MNRTLKRVYNLRSGRKMIYDNTTLIFFDLETTGFNSFHNNIIEIAAIDNNGNTFSKLIDPGIPIPKKITEITHITNEMVAYEPSIDEVLYEFVEFCKYDELGKPRNMRNTYLVAHNCISFDRVFLERKLAYCGIPSPGWKYIDTLHLSQYLLPDRYSHSLGNLAKYWNIVQVDAHRALSDVKVMMKIWNLLVHVWKTDERSYGFDPTGEDTLDVETMYRFLTLFKKKS